MNSPNSHLSASPPLRVSASDHPDFSATSSGAPRLIEVAFPLKQTSLDSVHEKNVRHGHISTLHIWPARRPLAACRAALIATLLPDPGDPAERAKILERLAGHVVPTTKKKKMPSGKIEEIRAEETVGGILHWGQESGPDLEWFREAIRKAYDGRAPKVLDPFAGGGAIPLEAIRVGCEATAIDINPVAWFVLKCTLEYPQKYAGKKMALPGCILGDREFMTEYFERRLGLKGAALKRRLKQHFGDHEQEGEFHELRETPSSYASDLQADLAWQVRAWGKWVLKQARRELAELYPTYATWEPVLETEKRKVPKDWLVQWKKEHAAEIEAKGLLLCPMTRDGEADRKELNKEFSAEYLAEPTNPRWVPKPTVAYLWARTVKNKHHPETTIPLLKTRWLCKKDDKRVLLTIAPMPGGTNLEFGIQDDVPKVGGNTAQRREHDRRVAAGTMSRSGVTCPVHGNIMTMEDIRLEGQAGRLGEVMTAVVVDGQTGKEYRGPSELERDRAETAVRQVETIYGQIPFGVPHEKIVEDAKRNTWCVQYGIDEFGKLFTGRQLATLGTIAKWVRAVDVAEWREPLIGNLSLSFDRLVSFCCRNVRYKLDAEAVVDAFARFAIPVLWDFAEAVPIGESAGAFKLCYERIASALDVLLEAAIPGVPQALQRTAKTSDVSRDFDVVATDPPYYDAIGYAVLMDFFYVWQRRILAGLSPEFDDAFRHTLTPKWDHGTQDGELVDDASRHGGDRARSKAAYEDGMASVFQACNRALRSDGRLVIVFANKQPDAWETLVSAIIKAGFLVDGSWPIATEMQNRSRALTSAALASSVWLVCKKRNPAARPGWDNTVLGQMRERIAVKLRDFWDAGIRGPDFVWAATGPAMEAYSQHPVVKKANKPNELMSVSEFLRHVRRMVLDFVVGRVLGFPHETRQTHEKGGESEERNNDSCPFVPFVGNELDDVTTYYLLHRNDFKMEEAPAGACILYCVSCNLSDRDLVDAFDLLVPSGGTSDGDEEEDGAGDDDEEMAEGSSSTFKLKPWNKRKRPGMGYDPVLRGPRNTRNTRKEEKGDSVSCNSVPFVGNPSSVGTVPLIDQIHRLMHLWRAGDVVKVDEYLNSKGLRTNALFPPVLQAVIEMADGGSEERAILESLSNHVQGRGVRAAYQQELPANDANPHE